MPVDASLQNVCTRPLPPIQFGKYVDFAITIVASLFDASSNFSELDDAVAHHPSVVQQVSGGRQAVTNVIGHPSLLARPVNLILQPGIPPHVIAILRDTHCSGEGLRLPLPLRIQGFTDIQGMLERVDARAICRLHRMQWFNRQRHASVAGIFQRGSNAVKHFALLANGGGVDRQPLMIAQVAHSHPSTP